MLREMKINKEQKIFAQKHNRLCRCFIGMNIGRNIRVSLENGVVLSGIVEKEGRLYKIGDKYLNGKFVTEVYPQ
jgi:hypothetical protein